MKLRILSPSLPLFIRFISLTVAIFTVAVAQAAEIGLTLQTRDPATRKIVLATEKVDAKRVAVIAVDVWNYHWCKTATMRVDAIAPRMNKALDAARALGMTVMLCPSDVGGQLRWLPAA